MLRDECRDKDTIIGQYRDKLEVLKATTQTDFKLIS